jgi:predicted kinase
MTTAKVANEHTAEKELKHAHSTGEIARISGYNKRKCLFRKCYTRRFSIEQSTDDINKAATPSDQQFYGPYAHIRKSLDYTYHSHYRKQRQWLQDSIIETFMENLVNGNDAMTTPQEPWFIYTVGAPGAGKRHTIMKLLEEGKLPLLSFVHVDPQEIRRRLPEFASYVLKSPDRVDRLTGKEAGHVMEILVRVALEKGKNVVLDGSLHDADWYAGFYQELRDKYPKMRVALLHITAPRELILHRAHVSAFAFVLFFNFGRICHVERGVRDSTHGCVLSAVECDSTILLCVVILDGFRTYVPLVTFRLSQFVPRYSTCIATTTIQQRNQKYHQDVEMWTHRHIPTERIDKILAQIPVSIERLRPEVNYLCELHNGGDGIKIMGDTWDHFSQTFQQTCAVVADTDKRSPEKLQEAIQAMFHHMTSTLWKKTLFAAGMSSEENYKATADEQGFYGPFADIRSTLDYSYHEHYEKNRQSLQDKILTDMLNSAVITDKNGNVCTTPTEPWLVFTAGAMGAGKSYTMNMLVEKGRFPLLAFVLVDPDEIRRHLPEFHIYVEQNPELAGELTRKEAGLIAEILTLAGLRSGKNVLVDGSLRDAEWYKGYLHRLRQEFPNNRQAIIHVTAPREAVFQRAAARAMTTGRIVPKEVLEEALDQVPRSVRVLEPLVDYFCEINNAPGAPDLELLTEGETWETFESKWVQTCAWIPNRRQFLRRARDTNKAQSLAVMSER